MKSVNQQDLTPSEYRSYKTNEKKMFDSFDELYTLLEYPPFSVAENGDSNPELFNEAQFELLKIMGDRDENDMIGGVYKPFRQYEEQFSEELKTARRLRSEGLSPAQAILKYAEEKKIKLDSGFRYYYGI